MSRFWPVAATAALILFTFLPTVRADTPQPTPTAAGTATPAATPPGEIQIGLSRSTPTPIRPPVVSQAMAEGPRPVETSTASSLAGVPAAGGVASVLGAVSGLAGAGLVLYQVFGRRLRG